MRPTSNPRRRALRRKVLTAVAGVTLLAGVACSPAAARAPQGGDGAGPGCSSSTWTQPNADKAGTRNMRTAIDSTSVDALTRKWTVPLLPIPNDRWPGRHATTPVIVDDVVYTQDLDSNVYAIELETGRQLWTARYDSYTNGPNGVAVDDGIVLGATKTEAFGLDAKTGREVWKKSLIRNKNEAIDMAPGVHDGTMYISTVPSFLDGATAAGSVGTVWAMDAKTGKTKWRWNTVPTDLWGNPEINGGGGLWYPPTFDDEGFMYVAVANPTPFLGSEEHPWASSRPGPNLYTNSIVKLDTRDGKVVWHQQEVPHDIYDWDLQNSPMLATVEGREVVVASGKPGFVYIYDRKSGERLHKTPVGKHNGHDDDNLKAMRGEKMPPFPIEIFPGVLGGVAAPGAVDGNTAFFAVNNMKATWPKPSPPPIFPAFTDGVGEVAAVDLVTGKVKWSAPTPESPYGAATVTNDLVFTTTFDGTVYGFNTETGEQEWQEKLRGSTNSPIVVQGDWLVTAAGWPQAEDEKAEIVAYKLDRGKPAAADAAVPEC